MEIFNEEHNEARQERTNTDRNEYIKSLPPEDQRKFEVVERVCQMLLEENIDFLFFPILPAQGKMNKLGAWQWNSFYQKIKYDEKGNISEESLGKINLQNGLIMASIFNFYTTGVDLPIEQKGLVFLAKTMKFLGIASQYYYEKS